MLTTKDKIEQFKRDLRSYTYHRKRIDEINELLFELGIKIVGVSSPTIKDVVIENAKNPYSDRKLQYLMEEEELVKERNRHALEIQRLNNALNFLDKEMREILINVYVKKKSYDSVSAEKYISRDKLKHDINCSIKALVENKNMNF